jgi:hypothetical protein
VYPLLHDHMTAFLFVTSALLLTNDSVTGCTDVYAMLCVSHSSLKLGFVMMQLTFRSSHATDRWHVSLSSSTSTKRPMHSAAHVTDYVQLKL